MKPRVLVVDDEPSIREFLEIMLKKEKYEVTCAESAPEALKILKNRSFDLVISDLQMPEMTGLELLKEVKMQYPDMLFMMITAFGTTETAVEAMKLGAYDYLTKPFKIDEVRINVAHALKSRNLEVENRNLKKILKQEYSFENIVGNSDIMHSLFGLLKRVSQTDANVLITGESGTGKEVVARAIHNNGSLQEQPFVSVNCGALPENLIESELFGHKKGSFTGAYVDKVGLFEAADGGTLFLDEVGELPFHVQSKLLRVLQERVIRRVGSTEDTKIEVRIIAATNKNLEEMVENKQFREDLFYRLNVISVDCPSLRDRKEDIPILCNHFLKKYAHKLGKDIRNISREALEVLSRYDYPGNVRELENIIERTIALEVGPTILPESLPPFVSTLKGQKIVTAQEILITEDGVELDKILGYLEKELMIKAIHMAGGVKRKAANLLNISFRSMRYRAEKYDLVSIFEDEESEDKESVKSSS